MDSLSNNESILPVCTVPQEVEHLNDPRAIGIEHAPFHPAASSAHPHVAVKDENTPAMTIGRFGHIFRRIYHVTLFTSLSYIYYWFGDDLDRALSWGDNGSEKLLTLLALLQIVLEAIRIKMGLICFGLRSYERYQISAQAWGSVGAILVLLSSPIANGKSRSSASSAERAYIGMPIIWSLGIVDPLIGELKGHGWIGRFVNGGRGFSLRTRSAIATFVVIAIWAGIWAIIEQAEWWLLPIMGPLTVLAEYPSLSVIDDNGMMALIPLAASLLLRPFY